MNDKRSFWERWQYRLDSIYSRSTTATVITLGLLTLLLAALATAVIYFTRWAPGDEESFDLLEAIWVGLLSAIGNGSVGGRETIWGYRLLMLFMTFGSIFIASFFISALTNGMVARVNELKKGRSKIVEDGHTVILGWSEQIFTVIAELMIANASQPKFVLAVLGNAPKEEMEDQIDQRIEKTGKTRIVCRTGDPMEMADLKIISLNTAKNIIILQPDSEYPDADVIKTVLAITNHPNRRKEPYRVFAGIRNPRNQDIAMVAGRDEVEWLVTSDIVSRVIAQTSLQPGLSAIYDDLFDFADQEIYLKEEPLVCGRTFGQALFASERNSVIGLYTNDQKILLNPPSDRVIQHGEKVIVIAVDDSMINFDLAGQDTVQANLISLGAPSFAKPKQILILGWNWRGSKIINELDNYVSKGSEVTVLADQEKIEEVIERECMALDNLTVCFFPGDTDDRQVLEGILFKPYDHVIILGYSDKLSIQRADAKTLVTLLHLRDIKDRDQLGFTVVTEMMDIRNYELASTARADDYVVSNRLISLLLAQIAENRELKLVFMDLLDPQTNEIYLKPVCQYVQTGQPVNYYTVVEAARQRGEVALGYRVAANATDPKQGYGIVLNSRKSVEVTFVPEDKIVVLAQS